MLLVTNISLVGVKVNELATRCGYFSAALLKCRPGSHPKDRQMANTGKFDVILPTRPLPLSPASG